MHVFWYFHLNSKINVFTSMVHLTQCVWFNSTMLHKQQNKQLNKKKKKNRNNEAIDRSPFATEYVRMNGTKCIEHIRKLENVWFLKMWYIRIAHQRIGAILAKNGYIHWCCVIWHTESSIFWPILKIMKVNNRWQWPTNQPKTGLK